MYERNHLAACLRRASIGADDAPFLHDHQTGETVTYGGFFANAERMAAVDAVLLVTDHSSVDYQRVLDKAELVVDTRGIYRQAQDNLVKA